MEFQLKSPSIPLKCPDCGATGRKNQWNFCGRCAGTGYIVRWLLTYPESYDTGLQPCGRTMFAGFIERPYCE